MKTTKKAYEAKVDELQDLLDWVDDFLSECEAKMKDIININIAVEEIFVNIASYAYENMENKGTEITLLFDGKDVGVEFLDYGLPFDPLAKKDPDIKASLEERGIGGLGIYMVKKSMDECSYRREDDKNIFTMRKCIKE